MARKKAAEQIPGQYAAIPHKVLDSVAFAGASHTAKSLLYELIRQHTGSNNGHFQLAIGWLRQRDWTSTDVVQRAKQELIARQLIVKTRLGGLNAGPDLYAVTWLTISNYAGLDMRAGQYSPGEWHYFTESKKPKNHSFKRNGAAPANGTAPPFTVPLAGTKTAVLDITAVPSDGNNVITNGRYAKATKRIVGQAGKSGRKRQSISPMAINSLPDDTSDAGNMDLLDAGGRLPKMIKIDQTHACCQLKPVDGDIGNTTMHVTDGAGSIGSLGVQNAGSAPILGRT